MQKHVLHWKGIKLVGIRGSEITMDVPTLLDFYYRGTLLSHILSMPKKRPVDLKSAIQLLRIEQDKAFSQGKFGDQIGHHSWYAKNFVSWISSNGYHIELNGDEFEAVNMQKMVA